VDTVCKRILPMFALSESPNREDSIVFQSQYYLIKLRFYNACRNAVGLHG